MTSTGVGYSVADLIRKGPLSRQGPERIALVFGERRVSYGELDQRSDRVAAGLAEAGFAKGDRAAILSHNSVEFVEVFFAVAKLGGILVPVNYMLRAAEVDYALADSGATWLFADEHGIEVAGGVLDERPQVRAIAIGAGAERGIAYEELAASTGPAPGPDLVSPSDVLLLQYTSGTTGFPKGATHTHATVLFNAMHQVPDFQLTEDDVYICAPALCWAAGLHNIVMPLWWIGGRVVLQPSRGFDPDDLCAAIAAEGGTVMIVVASVLSRLVSSGALERHDLSRLRLLATGGEAVSLEMLETVRGALPQTDVLQVYGQSEFPTLMALLSADRALEKPASTGKATSLCELRVVDSEGRELPPDEHGDIICRSPATMVGYWEKPEQTAATIVDGWLWTGDRGYTDEDGFLYIAGRSKEMYISGGLNVYPAEIEVVLASHPDVSEAAVRGVEHDSLGEVGCAFVVGEAVDLEQVEAFCRERLATYKVPKRWVLRDEPLPRTASGKPEKHRLEIPAEAAGA